MVDFTSAADQFAQALAEGDLCRALGVPEDARKLDIDVAAARISDRAPQLAGQVTAVANVLTNRDLKATYQILCRLRDSVCQTVADQCGEELHEVIPGYRAAIWEKFCELLRFDIDQPDIAVGPRGAASLAERGQDWVIESLLRSRLMVLKCANKELREGVATREVWYTECPVCHYRRKIACTRKRPFLPQSAGPGNKYRLLDHRFNRFRYNYHVPACPNCTARGVDPSIHDDTYTFRFANESPPGTVVRGEGRHSKKAVLATLSGMSNSVCSPKLLDQFYFAHEKGHDPTLDEVEDGRQPKLPEGYVGPQERRATAGAGSGSSGFAPWTVWIIIYLVLRVGCSLTWRLADQQERRRREMDSWRSPTWRSVQIEPSYPRKIVEPGTHRTWRDASAPGKESVSQDQPIPPDVDGSELHSRSESETSELDSDE